jgi:hypothetical protein
MKACILRPFLGLLMVTGCWLPALAGDPCPYKLPAEGITQKDADAQAAALAETVRKFDEEAKKRGGRVYSSDVGLLQAASELHNLGKYEEGASPTPQLRSGHETDFYNTLKAFARNNPGQKLGPQDLLNMGLDACADANGNVDLQQVYLTVHNVMRILARPDQWGFDQSKYNKDPAVSAIFNDVLGIKSSDGTAMLPDMMGMNRATKDGKTLKKGEVYDKIWTLPNLFSTEPGKGLFAPQPGVKDFTGNGGAHYYFWLGALAKARGGSAAVLTGMWTESRAKRDGGPCEYARGVMQLTHFGAGSKMADAAGKKTGGTNTPAPAPAPPLLPPPLPGGNGGGNGGGGGARVPTLDAF